MRTRAIKSITSRKRPSLRSTRAKSAKTPKTGSTRLDMRLERRTKTLIERAAAITGQTITDFVVSNLVESAMATIERHERLVLSNRDRDRFLAALDRPAKSLPMLAKAARRHSEVTRGE